MIDQSSLLSKMSVGGTDLSALRRAARDNSPEAMKAVAQQFESLLVNMMLKSMREATPKSSLFDSDANKLYTSLLDQQVSQNVSRRGIGLADALLRQLSPKNALPAADPKASETLPDKQQVNAWKQTIAETLRQQQVSLVSSLSQSRKMDEPYSDNLSQLLNTLTPGSRLAFTGDVQAVLSETVRSKQLQAAVKQSEETSGQWLRLPALSKPSHVREFQAKLSAEAEEASRSTGIPADFLLGQAALETGWGKHVIKTSDGSSSHNLFGIKATKGWKGKVVETTTTEYVNGVAYRKKEKFRAYDSYADSFHDYARLLQSNPRYQNVLANAGDASSFAWGLQRAGYATDPQYANKLTRIIQKSLSV